MLLKIRPQSQEYYQSDYEKTSFYKKKQLAEIKSRFSFVLSLKQEKESLQMNFTSTDLAENMSKMLIFSPIYFEENIKTNTFEIKNKNVLKVQWNKFKEKNRSSKNNTFLFLYERLYFKIPLGLEYDLLSNGSHLPFLVNIYNKQINIGTVIPGMLWVHTPLSLPLKIDYVVKDLNDTEMTLGGVISLDENNLTRLLADKNFQQQARPYHYTKDFSIISDFTSVYDVKTGYLKSSKFSLTIFSENEEINESIVSSTLLKNM
jgi:hypothetical protein